MGINININPRLQSWGDDNQQDSLNRFNDFELVSMFSHSLYHTVLQMDCTYGAYSLIINFFLSRKSN